MIQRFVRGRTLAQSIAVATALLVVILIGTTLFVVESRVAASLRSGLEARGYSVARSIGAVATPSLLAYNYPALQIAALGASEDPDIVYVLIHDREGEVAGIAGHAPVPAALASRLSPTPVQPASFYVQLPDAHGAPQQILEVRVPVRVEDVAEPWGTVRVGLSYASVAAQLRSLMGNLIVLGLTLVLGAVASGVLVARRITAPLRRLAKGTEALSAGDMSHRIPVTGALELADLARAFNGMMDRVQEKARESRDFQNALESLNATLEAQVGQRTRALEESEAQYRALVEHSPDAIMIVQDARLRFVNRSFLENFGLGEDEVAAPDFDLARIFDASSCALVRGRIAAWERGENPGPAEVMGKDPAGKMRYLELRGGPIDYKGRPAVECLLIDTTETRRLRDKLVETEKLRALGELAGGVAHDFNNLLGAMLGRAQLLRRRGFPADVDRDLAVIEKAAQDGRETIRRIQEFSRTRRDRKFVPVDLGEVIRDSLEITRSRWKSDAERRNVVIHVSTDTPSLPPVLGNATELREVFTNLILNAVDAMPQGGKLSLRCWREAGRILAEVRDTGVGMTEAIRRQLFDPFFTTKGSRGMGLGMSVAYGIVTRHEGRIDVSTEIGKGTVFTLDFPAAREPLHVAGGDGAALPMLLRPGRILVIDDEPEVAAVVRDVLVAEGHTVDTATSGSHGVELADVSDYDLVFTDLGMPDMSGWEVADKIRRSRPRTPIVMITGWGMSVDDGEARRRGVATVVHKPFDIAELVRTATEMLSDSESSGVAFPATPETRR